MLGGLKWWRRGLSRGYVWHRIHLLYTTCSVCDGVQLCITYLISLRSVFDIAVACVANVRFKHMWVFFYVQVVCFLFHVSSFTLVYTLMSISAIIGLDMHGTDLAERLHMSVCNYVYWVIEYHNHLQWRATISNSWQSSTNEHTHTRTHAHAHTHTHTHRKRLAAWSTNKKYHPRLHSVTDIRDVHA